jgi:hypothetical protein
MYLCESCGIWINCSIHRVDRWKNYLNNLDIRHDCPKRCQEVCAHASGFQHKTGWSYFNPLLNNPPTNFQPNSMSTMFVPINWNATSSTMSIGAVSDNFFR